MGVISMTGYGKTVKYLDDCKISVEIKTLNSKNLEIKLKTPAFLSVYDIEIRKLIRDKLNRGTVDIYIDIEVDKGFQNSVIDENILLSYYTQMGDLCKKLKLKEPVDWLSLLVRLPDVVKIEKFEVDEVFWQKLQEVIDKALTEVIKSRKREGKELEKDILKRIKLILEKLLEIEKQIKSRNQKIRIKMLEALQGLKLEGEIDKSRFEQELLYYLEKYDITEEIVRTKSHCKYFIDVVKNEDNQGKKLGFILQEINREVNTMGAKANDLDIQKLTVEMKDELEKIKEQCQNIL